MYVYFDLPHVTGSVINSPPILLENASEPQMGVRTCHKVSEYLNHLRLGSAASRQNLPRIFL